MFYGREVRREVSNILYLMNLLISYDIHNNKLRTQFAKMLTRNGAIRLQYSVYEANNTERILNNLRIIIEEGHRG